MRHADAGCRARHLARGRASGPGNSKHWLSRYVVGGQLTREASVTTELLSCTRRTSEAIRRGRYSSSDTGPLTCAFSTPISARSRAERWLPSPTKTKKIFQDESVKSLQCRVLVPRDPASSPCSPCGETTVRPTQPNWLRAALRSISIFSRRDQLGTTVTRSLATPSKSNVGRNALLGTETASARRRLNPSIAAKMPRAERPPLIPDWTEPEVKRSCTTCTRRVLGLRAARVARAPEKRPGIHPTTTSGLV